jgi:hypothetical protein
MTSAMGVSGVFWAPWGRMNWKNSWPLWQRSDSESWYRTPELLEQGHNDSESDSPRGRWLGWA